MRDLFRLLGHIPCSTIRSVSGGVDRFFRCAPQSETYQINDLDFLVLAPDRHPCHGLFDILDPGALGGRPSRESSTELQLGRRREGLRACVT
jgi:hypothetical protein